MNVPIIGIAALLPASLWVLFSIRSDPQIVELFFLRTGERKEGMILDADGNPTTEPRKYRPGGVQLPFGAHKGYSLCFMLEALCGGLTGSSCAPLPDYAGDWSLLMHVLRIEAFQPLDGPLR